MDTEYIFATLQRNSSTNDTFMTRNEAEDVMKNSGLSVTDDVDYKAPNYFIYMIIAISCGAGLLVVLVGTIIYGKCIR